MPAALEYVAYSALVPAVAALATAWLCRQLLPAAVAERYALPLALAVGFFTGYWLLPDWAALVPARHWHWLPWLGAAAVLGAISRAEGVTTGERWLVFAALAAMAAWKLVPTWPHLSPPRSYWVPLLAAYLFSLVALLSALPDRLLGRAFVGLLAASTVAGALMVTIGASVMIGRVGAVAAAAVTA